ncbi:zeta toxin family protein [Sphingopyxis macrogoltabida]|uniref:Toxin n=1 Tax=Sphingopyxis macrogoltabida TaxID=33050 RepID=A0AAC8Z0Q3_SPHMC|nr:zeta toxin family protein [Sphingopyxis macrogoltabida]ALJ13033.1 toxin [Sphingopyxis macrogoltabida]AMU89499.1 toxin [Sphingopyxis macrogoltabida]
MTQLSAAVEQILDAQKRTKKPLAIILAGHNGSGKSTMWRKSLSGQLQIPLLNADRMMLSILPEADSSGALVDWAQALRDTDLGWMQVAQSGVKAFAAHAMAAKVPFAMETVFSHWDIQEDGTVKSKIDLITDLQDAGYFVLLLFVGLANVDLSVLRVMSRVADNGHNVPQDKLVQRFPRTQLAIREAAKVADATIFTDNSRDEKRAFTVSRVQLGEEAIFDLRAEGRIVAPVILEWLEKVSPVDVP